MDALLLCTLPSRFSAAPHRVVAHNPAVRAAPPHRRTYLIGAILRRQCVGDAATKRSFFEFSLCLSRACLGEKSILMYTWLEKTVCSPAVVPRRRAVAANLVDNLQETLLFSHLVLAYVCPEPVLVNVSFSVLNLRAKNALKSHRLCSADGVGQRSFHAVSPRTARQSNIVPTPGNIY